MYGQTSQWIINIEGIWCHAHYHVDNDKLESRSKECLLAMELEWMVSESSHNQRKADFQ